MFKRNLVIILQFIRIIIGFYEFCCSLAIAFFETNSSSFQLVCSSPLAITLLGLMLLLIILLHSFYALNSLSISYTFSHYFSCYNWAFDSGLNLLGWLFFSRTLMKVFFIFSSHILQSMAVWLMMQSDVQWLLNYHQAIRSKIYG